MYVSVVGVPVVARLSPLACVTARGKCFARVYEIKPDGLPLKSRIFPSRPLEKKSQESSRKAGKAKKAAQKATKSHKKPASLPLRDCSRSAA